MVDETMQTNGNGRGVETPELLTVREAYVRLRISKWKLYDLLRRRLLDSVRIGRRRLIPAGALAAYVGRLRQGEFLA